MHTLFGMLVLSGGISWQILQHRKDDTLTGLRVEFPLTRKHSRRDALRIVGAAVERNNLPWLHPSRTLWKIDVEGVRQWLAQSAASNDFLQELDWLHGVVSVTPEVEDHEEKIFDRVEQRTCVRLDISKEEYMLDKNTKLFLSHKGVDKPMVRRFCAALRTIGFDPWLDEDAMTAGTELHRGVRGGFAQSCAAVFFITPNFEDEKYLRQEINYAVEEKTKKGDRFAIVTLVFPDNSKRKAVVPELLRSYVWKEVEHEIDGLGEIVRALPIQLGPPNWKHGLADPT